jgi:hypothetical protein
MSSSRVLFVIFALIALAVGLFVFIFASGDVALRTELSKEAAKTLLQLVLIGVGGTYAKFLLDQYVTERQRQIEQLERDNTLREARRKARIEALNALTTSYWQIKKAFHIISAHRSAKSYGEQMRQIIDYRLELQRLNNEIAANMYVLDDKEAITGNLTEMDGCLEEVLQEWKDVYLQLSQLQKQDEATDKPEEKKVPHKIDALPELNRIKQDRFKAFHGLFEKAANPIRKQILRESKSLPDS